MTSRKVIARRDDRDFTDCVNRGYSWTLYADGRVAAEYVTRWQGSRSGQRWTTDPGACDTDAPESDLAAFAEACVHYTMYHELDESRDWRQTATGYVIH